MSFFVPGAKYKRKELHAAFGGQRQGGISTPTNYSAIFIFTGTSGESHGYEDGWDENGLFFYTGEGQVGNMSFIRGNAAIRDHLKNNKDLHLFQSENGKIRYIDQMVCVGYEIRKGKDTHNDERNIIVFQLSPLKEYQGENQGGEKEDSKEIAGWWHKSKEELRKEALVDRPVTIAKERKQLYRERSKAVRYYVLKRANGVCEGCGEPAPFRNKEGILYLEPHHIKRLSDGGPDNPSWVAGLCPNCHRKAHYSDEAKDFNKSLLNKVAELESQSD
jgi:5-methylcytosine-specific restriction protein A